MTTRDPSLHTNTQTASYRPLEAAASSRLAARTRMERGSYFKALIRRHIIQPEEIFRSMQSANDRFVAEGRCAMTGLTKAGLLVLGALVVGYIAWVAHFEWKLGRDQPQGPTSLVIVTTKNDGSTRDRVLSRLVDNDGSLYVAVNDWPRAWYRHALANPQLQITMDGETGRFPAVPVEGPQHDYLMERFPLRFRSRLQMGFPPRYFLRLDPALETR